MYSRNITVFSAELAAFTIPHEEEKKPKGPDLLISYHDNDHYNSVVSSSSSNFKPPEEHDNQSTVSLAQVEDLDSSKYANVKKGDPCPCGSGQKYKKCCFKRAKHLMRVKKMEEPISRQSNGDDKVDRTVDGFRIMKIW